MAIGARSQSAKTYLERHYTAFPELPREELIRHAVRALHTCTETDKDLNLENTVIAVVGVGERFTIIEGEAVAPFLVGIEAVPRPVHETDAQAATRIPGEGEDATSAASFAPSSLQPPAAEGGGGAASSMDHA